MSPNPQEHEVALLIAADDAPQVAAAIARATHLAGYNLVSAEDEQLHDVMFDTAEHALRAQGFAFRTRTRNGSRLITLKGAPRADEHGGVSRLEIELPWSADSLRRVAAELARAHIKLSLPDALGDARPADTLRAAGLLPIQDRRTRRQVREIWEPRLNARMAELAVDQVAYQFEAGVVQLVEVEIEAKHADADAVLHACMLALQADFGAMLRAWPYGKLATGALIERLLQSGELAPLLLDGERIGAQASLLLEDRLRK